MYSKTLYPPWEISLQQNSFFGMTDFQIGVHSLDNPEPDFHFLEDSEPGAHFLEVAEHGV